MVVSILTRQVAQPLSVNRENGCNPAVVNNVFEKLTAVNEDLGLRGKTKNVFNVNETGPRQVSEVR